MVPTDSQVKPNGDLKRPLSYRKFLRTGILGPLLPTMTLMDVAKAFGTPDGWITADHQTFPLYSAYGRREISFEDAAPHNIDFFQLEFIESLTPSGDSLGNDFWLDPDGLHGMMKPSDLLRARLWPQVDVRVTVDVSFRNALTLDIGGLSIIFTLNEARYPRHDDGAEPPFAVIQAEMAAVDTRQAAMQQAMTAASEAGDLATLVSLCDETAICDSIYSRPSRPPIPWTKPDTNFHEMTGQRYLALLKSAETPR